MKNADTPATASHHFEDDNLQGLTKREAFAMAAMQGLLANRGIIDDHHSQSISWIANHAISQADAMLKELDK